MKLPEELEKQLHDIRWSCSPTLGNQAVKELLYEAIVRDCAATARSGHRLKKDYVPDAVRDAGCIEAEQAILARYKLEPK